MTDEVDVLIELLEDVLGDHKQHYASKGQISFDCPVCAMEKGLDEGDGKGNLEINYVRHVYKCWACSETNGTHGPLGKLFRQTRNKETKESLRVNQTRRTEERGGCLETQTKTS